LADIKFCGFHRLGLFAKVNPFEKGYLRHMHCKQHNLGKFKKFSMKQSAKCLILSNCALILRIKPSTKLITSESLYY